MGVDCLDIGGRNRVQSDAIGAEARGDRRIHAIGYPETAEQKIPALAEAPPAVLPDLLHAGDISAALLGQLSRHAALGMNVHGKIAAEGTEAGMHLAHHAACNSPRTGIPRP